MYLGLAIGFAIGGAALVHFLPQLQALRQDTAAPPAAQQVAERQTAPSLMPAPAPLPRVAPALPHWNQPAPPPLPQVVHPDQPGHGGGVAGTGFFIAGDGTLLTAAHVVAACRRIQVVSRLVRRTAARVVATDPTDDAALLQAENTRPPAVLPLGRPEAPTGRLFVLGYPASAGLRVPEETWGALENARLPPGVGVYGDPRFLVWLEAAAVRHGYSGGPILDPRNGMVVGLVKGTVDPAHLRGVPRMPRTGIAIGPGAGRLIGFLQQQEPWLDVSLVSAQGDDAVALARRATVHVLCWR